MKKVQEKGVPEVNMGAGGRVARSELHAERSEPSVTEACPLVIPLELLQESRATWGLACLLIAVLQGGAVREKFFLGGKLLYQKLPYSSLSTITVPGGVPGGSWRRCPWLYLEVSLEVSLEVLDQ